MTAMSEENTKPQKDHTPPQAQDEKSKEELPPPPQIISEPAPQPATMEVHKHAHHVMHKKKWAEYVLEFLMIFLAVFLGFLAENFREHQVDKERGKQYTRMLVEDLSVDTTTFSIVQLRVNGIIANLDSSIKTIQNEQYSDEKSMANLYRFNFGAFTGFTFFGGQSYFAIKKRWGNEIDCKDECSRQSPELLEHWRIHKGIAVRVWRDQGKGKGSVLFHFQRTVLL